MGIDRRSTSASILIQSQRSGGLAQPIVATQSAATSPVDTGADDRAPAAYPRSTRSTQPSLDVGTLGAMTLGAVEAGEGFGRSIVQQMQP